MTDRDKLEVGSKFWNEGKFNNFVAPFLPPTPQEATFIDIGCNAGLFLMLAEQKGFKRVIGIDSDHDAIVRGIDWRDKHGMKYQMYNWQMEKCLDKLPLADYTVIANTHYYLTINDWMDYLDKLQYKTRFVIIVTAEGKRKQLCWASNFVADIRGYFKQWKEIGFIDALPTEGDPMPRQLWSLCFESPNLQRVPIELLKSRNTQQDSFYIDLDKGIPYDQTAYWKFHKAYRKWTEGHLRSWFEERIKVYEDIKINGITRPIYVNSEYLILDGNHKYGMLKHLGYKTVFVRIV